MASPGKKKGATKTGGRKKGTPNKATAEVRELAGEYTEDALKTLVQIMNDNKAAAAARIAAAKAVLDRGHGKPAQALEHDIKDVSLTKIIIQRFGDDLDDLIDAPITE